MLEPLKGAAFYLELFRIADSDYAYFGIIWPKCNSHILQYSFFVLYLVTIFYKTHFRDPDYHNGDFYAHYD